MAPEFIEGFELLEKLGEGGMGTVYRARQLSLDRAVAIKILPPGLSSDASYIAQFRAEAKVAATLKHSNIVQIYEAGHHGNTHYFVMELVSGYTVGQWLARKGRLPLDDSLTVVEYVAEALKYAWDKAQVVHGDIKPDNIMVDEDGSIKLSDFLAMSRTGGGTGVSTHSVIGTPNYMSPEQILGESKLDYRSDVYALGAVLYHLVTGKLPFQDVGTDDEILQGQLHGHLKDPIDIIPDLPQPVAWLIEKMLVKDPNERRATWSEILADIDRVRAGKLPTPPYPADGSSTIRRSAKRLPPVTMARPAPANTRLSQSSRHKSKKEAVSLAEKALYVGLILVILAVAAWILRTQTTTDSPGNTRPIVVATPTPRVARPPLAAHTPAATSRPRPRHHAMTTPSRMEETTAADDYTMDQSSSAMGESEAIEESSSESEPRDEGTVDQSAAGEHSASEQTMSEATQEASSQALPAAALLEYAALVEQLVKYSKSRGYDQAIERVRNWLQRHEGNPFVDNAERDIQRMGWLKNMFSLIEQNKDAVTGTVVHARPNIVGTIEDISNGKMILVRKTSTADIEARFSVSIMALYERDLLALLKSVAPDQYRVNEAMFYASKGQLDAARKRVGALPNTAMHAADVKLWVDEWRRALLDGQANRAFNRVLRLVRSGEFEQAAIVLEEALSRYGESTLLSVSQATEVKRIRQAIGQALSDTNRLSPQPPKKEAVQEEDEEEDSGVKWLDASEDLSLDSEGPAAEPVISWSDMTLSQQVNALRKILSQTPPEQKEIEQVTPGEINESLFNYDQKIIKLRFIARSGIQQQAPGVYIARLGDRSGHFTVAFDDKGYKWIHNIEQSGTMRKRNVYGIVQADKRLITLIGRKRISHMGGASATYAW